MTKEELVAARLTEKTMAVSEFENYDDFKQKIKQSNFNIDYEEDVSSYIVPTLKKFEKLANIFFDHPRLAKIIAKIFPKEFVYNAVAGYLLPNMINLGIGCYYITILRKKA